MRWILYGIVGVIIATMIHSPFEVRASQNPEYKKDRWTSAPMELVLKQAAHPDKFEPLLCGFEATRVRTAYDATPQNACVFGGIDSFKMARYTNTGGRSFLLVSYPSDSAFYVVRGVCEGAVSCIYSHATDSLIVAAPGPSQHIVTIYSDVSKHLKRQFDASVMQYYYTLSSDTAQPLNTLSKRLPMNEIAISKNGKWAAIDYMNVGVVRLNMETGEQRRVYPGISSSGSYRLSITDDGATIAAFHWASGYKLIGVNDTCGDRITEDSTGDFSKYVEICATQYIYPRDVDSDSISMPLFVNDTLFSLRAGAFDFTYRPASVSGERINYLALGDSFSSGEGEVTDAFYISGTNAPPDNCHVSNRSYPLRMQQIPITKMLVTDGKNIACSGATMRDILGYDQYSGQGGRNKAGVTSASQALSRFLPGIVPQASFIDVYQPKYVTVGIGGNDAGFMNKLKSCIGPGTCEWALEGDGRRALAKEIDALYDTYTRVIEEVKARSSDSEIRMVSYPQIINDTSDAKCGTVLDILFSHEERRFITRSIERVNYVMYTAAQAAGVKFVDISTAYLGHMLCDKTQTPAMNAIRIGDDISPIAALSNLKIIGAESFHPTPYGHELAADIVAQSFSNTELGYRQVYAGPSIDEEYWQQGSSGEGFRYKQLVSDIADTLPGREFSETVDSGVFASSSEVHVTVRSAQAQVLQYKTVSGDDGGMYYKIEPNILSQSGIYTVYLSGVTPSGEKIVLYRMIAVGDGTSSSIEVPLPGLVINQVKALVQKSMSGATVTTNNTGGSSSPVEKTAAGNTHSIQKEVLGSKVASRYPLPYLVLLGVVGIGVLVAVGIWLLLHLHQQKEKKKEV